MGQRGHGELVGQGPERWVDGRHPQGLTGRLVREWAWEVVRPQGTRKGPHPAPQYRLDTENDEIEKRVFETRSM